MGSLPPATAFVRQPAPEFKAEAIVNGEIKTVSLADYKGKYVYLFFYPFDFTFVCPTEIIAFSDSVDKFKALNAEVLGVSVDSVYTHNAWINTPRKQGGLGGCKLPLIADVKREMASSYNVLLPDGMALRGSFIIDDKGILRHITVNDTQVGRSVDEALRLIKAFQYTDKHGEVCPANWDESKPAMKGSIKGSQEYFNKLG